MTGAPGGRGRRRTGPRALAARAAAAALASALAAGPVAPTLTAASPGEAEAQFSLATACEAGGDAAPAIQALVDARSAAGGGEVVLPAGRTCVLAAPVELRSNVVLRCGPATRLVAPPGERAALTGSDLRDVSIEGCAIELGAGAAAAIDLAGGGLAVRRTRVAAVAAAGPRGPLLELDCAAGGACAVLETDVACSGEGAGERIGIAVRAAGPRRAVVADGSVEDCSVGIQSEGPAAIRGNRVRVAGEASAGIRVRSDAAEVTSNEVDASGAQALGIAVRGRAVVVSANRVRVDGDGATAYSLEGIELSLLGNAHVLRGERAIGYAVAAAESTIGQCMGTGERTGRGQVHVEPVGAQQLVVGDCHFRHGAFGVAARPGRAGKNVTVDANRMFGLTSACVVATTGFVVTGNYCAWLGDGGHALVLGDDRPPGADLVHAIVSANLFHCRSCSALVVPTTIGGTCGRNPRRVCTDDRDCADAGRCRPPRIEDLVFTSNSLLGTNGGVGIDLSAAAGRRAPSLSDWVITGNQFHLLGSCTGIRFPTEPVARERVRGIALGVNSMRCPTDLAGFADAMREPSVASP